MPDPVALVEMLAGKIVVIAGGAGLLGRHFSRIVAAQGAAVVVADQDLAAAELVAKEIVSKHVGQGASAAVDITSEESVAALLSMVVTQFGRVDAVVNAAYPRNQHYGRSLERVTYKDFCENVGLHLGGYFLVSQQFGLYFKGCGRGNIVNLASIYGTMVPRFHLYVGTEMTMPVEYAAIKAGVIQMSRYMAEYFKRDGVRVNCLSPGGVLDRQPQSFLDRYAAECGAKGTLAPEDLGGGLLFLLSDASQFMTGQNLIVDDGFSL